MQDGDARGGCRKGREKVSGSLQGRLGGISVEKCRRKERKEWEKKGVFIPQALLPPVPKMASELWSWPKLNRHRWFHQVPFIMLTPGYLQAIDIGKE